MANNQELRRILRTINHYKRYGINVLVIKSPLKEETISSLVKLGISCETNSDGTTKISWI